MLKHIITESTQPYCKKGSSMQNTCAVMWCGVNESTLETPFYSAKKKGLSVQNTGTVLYFSRYFKAGEEVTAPIEGKAFTSPQAIKYKHFSGR